MEQARPSDMAVGRAATDRKRAGSTSIPVEPVLANFIANLRQARQQAGMTQEALAVACGMERTYISYLERGQAEPKLRMIARLAEGLETPASELLRGL
jgi:DNA-binding XRE family transcriptional regulator